MMTQAFARKDHHKEGQPRQIAQAGDWLPHHTQKLSVLGATSEGRIVSP